MEMFQEYTEDEKMKKIIQIFHKYDLSPDIIRQAADIMDPIDEPDEIDSVCLHTNNYVNLNLPEYNYLRRKLSMTSSSYKRLRKVYENCGGRFKFKGKIVKNNIPDCTVNFYVHIHYLEDGTKCIYIGQMK